jgi:predicted DNA-binding protein with PD1-like motif
MNAVLLHDNDGLRTFALVLDTGDEAVASLTSFAHEHRLRASHFTAIGAFSDAVVAYFEWQTKQYRHIPIAEQVEVLSLAGDVTCDRGKPTIHAHVVLGKADASAHGGHLIEAHVRPTLEVVLTETPVHLRRRKDPASGLALIDPSLGSKPDAT